MQLLYPKGYDGNVVFVTRKSTMSGEENCRLMFFTHRQYDNWKNGGKCIQDAMPQLSPEDREFLMTGITPDEWDAAFA